MMERNADRDIEKAIRKDFSDFLEKDKETLSRLDEESRMFVAFISGAQIGAGYMELLEEQIEAEDEEHY